MYIHEADQPRIINAIQCSAACTSRKAFSNSAQATLQVSSHSSTSMHGPAQILAGFFTRVSQKDGKTGPQTVLMQSGRQC